MVRQFNNHTADEWITVQNETVITSPLKSNGEQVYQSNMGNKNLYNYKRHRQRSLVRHQSS